MIDKRAPLPCVEAQDQPRKGTNENENGALAAKLSPPSKINTRTHHDIIPEPDHVLPQPRKKNRHIQQTFSQQQHHKTHCF